MNVTITELIALMGVPSAITGLAVWALKKWLEKREKTAEERNKALTDILIAQVMCNNASLSLAEATATAVQRIPDAHCNGDMHEALEIARKMKHEQRELLTKIGIQYAVD
jgi:hypothetical protein